MIASRHRRRWPWVLVIVLVLLAAMVWWFPARWAWQFVRGDYPAVRVGDIEGSVWHGQADHVRVAGQSLGTLQWTLGRSALLGDLHGDVDLRGAGVMANGHIARDGNGAIVIDDAHFKVPMERLKVLWPNGADLLGQLRGDVDRARLVDGWPVQLRAHVRWHDAGMVTHGRTVMLGQWLSRWRASGNAAITARLHDDGNGPLRLRGRLTVTPLGWRIRADLVPRHAGIALRRWLRDIGKPMADGSVRIERHGGLMTGTAW
ncbi:MAG TPA: type II secretion system protein N [Oleiagrimonas sp.]|nr:type II secretion system protein N [Oleiagrimonas sp.]